MRTCELCGKKVGNKDASILHRNPDRAMGFMPWDEALQAEYTAVHCPAYLQYNIDKFQLKKPNMPDPRKATFTTNGEDVTHIDLTPPALDGSFWKRFESKKSLWKMPKHSKETDTVCLMPYHKDVSQTPFSGFWPNIKDLPFGSNDPHSGSCSFDTVYYDNNVPKSGKDQIAYAYAQEKRQDKPEPMSPEELYQPCGKGVYPANMCRMYARSPMLQSNMPPTWRGQEVGDRYIFMCGGRYPGSGHMWWHTATRELVAKECGHVYSDLFGDV